MLRRTRRRGGRHERLLDARGCSRIRSCPRPSRASPWTRARFGSSKPTFTLTPTAFAASNSSAMLTVDANDVYWPNLTFGTVEACAKASCTTPTTLAQNQTDGANVYWTERRDDDGRRDESSRVRLPAARIRRRSRSVNLARAASPRTGTPSIGRMSSTARSCVARRRDARKSPRR